MSVCSFCGHEKGTGSYCGGCGHRSASSNTPTPTPTQYQSPPQQHFQSPPQFQPQYGAPQFVQMSAQTNSLAIASLVVSLVCCAPLGVIFGHVAISQINRTGEGGRGLAVAGLVIGYVGMVFGVLYLIVVVGATSYGY